MKLVFATNNQHKLQEVKHIMGNAYDIASLTDINFTQELPETTNTFTGNAAQKANTIYKATQLAVFADDSGLVVPALGGEPGVNTAHYAGSRDSDKNIQKLIKKLEHSPDRNAYFISVFCLIINGLEYFFEGKVHGTINNQPTGSKGFGYDPVFTPKGYDISFAQMSNPQKNSISHRAIATKKMLNFIQQSKPLL